MIGFISFLLFLYIFILFKRFGSYFVFCCFVWLVVLMCSSNDVRNFLGLAIIWIFGIIYGYICIMIIIWVIVIESCR